MEKFSLVIPTYNHPLYLKRVLSYYNSFSMKCNILIADSSSDANKKENAKIISLFPDLSILHLDEYEITVNQYGKIANALGHATTTYSVLCADDDFIIPSAIYKSVDFLEKNPDFSCCHGHYVFYYTKQGKKKKFYWTPFLGKTQTSNAALEAKERMLSHFSNFSYTICGVHKTDVLKKVFSESIEATDDYRFGELLESLLTAVYGKIKFLDILYTIREFDMLNTGGGYLPKNTFRYFIEQGTYNNKYERFREKLASELKENSTLSLDDSKKTVDEGMELFMAKRLYSFQNKILSKIRGLIDIISLPNFIDKKIRKLYRDIFIYKRLFFYKERFFYTQRKKNDSFLEELDKVKWYVLKYPVDKREYVKQDEFY